MTRSRQKLPAQRHEHKFSNFYLFSVETKGHVQTGEKRQ